MPTGKYCNGVDVVRVDCFSSKDCPHRRTSFSRDPAVYIFGFVFVKFPKHFEFVWPLKEKKIVNVQIDKIWKKEFIHSFGLCCRGPVAEVVSR